MFIYSEYTELVLSNVKIEIYIDIIYLRPFFYSNNKWYILIKLISHILGVGHDLFYGREVLVKYKFIISVIINPFSTKNNCASILRFTE